MTGICTIYINTFDVYHRNTAIVEPIHVISS